MNDKLNADMDKDDGKKSEGRLIQPRREGVWAGLRSSFFAGIVVAAPIGITIAIISWFVTGPMAKLDAVVKKTLPDLGGNAETFLQVLPGVGVLIAVIGLILLGAVAKNFIGRSFIHAGERLVDSVPVVRNLYRFFKNVFEMALQQSERSFQDVALIEYPRKGSWVMAFVVGDARGEVRATLSDQGEDLTALFIPTVPNPTSGFLVFLPKDQLRLLTMTVEEAAKVIFSLGLVVPEFSDPDAAVKKLEEIAEEAGALKPKRKLFSLGGK